MISGLSAKIQTMERTSYQYDRVMEACLDVFTRKLRDYGPAWRVLRPASLTDQIYIKANRIRSIDRSGMHKVDEGILPEFTGIVNYAIIALIQLELGPTESMDLNPDEALAMFAVQRDRAKDLMMNKNHDYGEAWRNMRVSSLTDIILMKLLRIKQIEDNDGQTLISEGVDANYLDIINYAVFALILLGENEPGSKINGVE